VPRDSPTCPWWCGADRLGTTGDPDARKRGSAPSTRSRTAGCPDALYAAAEERSARRGRSDGAVHQPRLKEGAHIIAASFYRGGEVIAPELTPEQRKAYYDAENEAVDMINADFYKYAIT